MNILMHPIDEEDIEGQVYSEQSIHMCTKLLDDIVKTIVVTVTLSLHRNRFTDGFIFNVEKERKGRKGLRFE